MSTLEGGKQINDKNVLFYFDAANRRSYDGVSTNGYSLVLGTTASLLTGVTWSSVNGGAMRFNGTFSNGEFSYVADSWISCGNRISLLGLTFPFTLEAWINPKKLNGGTSPVPYGVLALDSMEQWGGSGNALSKYYGIDIVIGDNDGTDAHTFHCSYYNTSTGIGYGSVNRRSGYTSNRPVVCGVWNHVAAVVSGPDNFALYVNGESQTVSINGDYLGSSITWSGGTGRTIIGKPSGFYKSIFNGDIAMVRAYNSNLSTDDIKKNYNLHAVRFGLTRK